MRRYFPRRSDGVEGSARRSKPELPDSRWDSKKVRRSAGEAEEARRVGSVVSIHCRASQQRDAGTMRGASFHIRFVGKRSWAGKIKLACRFSYCDEEKNVSKWQKRIDNRELSHLNRLCRGVARVMVQQPYAALRGVVYRIL